MIDLQEAYNRVWEHHNKIVPFSKEEFDMIMSLGEIYTLSKGEYIYRQGKIPAYGGYVYEGALRHFHKDPDSGKETTVGFDFEDSCFGDIGSIFYNDPASTSLVVLEETLIRRLSKQHYLYLFENCKPFAKLMLLSMEKRYDALVSQLIQDRNDEAETAYLKMLNDFPQILQRVPQGYIASYLGITPQSLSRIRKNICQHKHELVS